jgi:secondary thiamine-phosphate synthase enzyme
MIKQININLPAYSRGMHLITNIINKNLPELPEYGLLHIFIKHTSAALTINENADPSVRVDFQNFIDKFAPDNTSYFTHTDEGPDDMPSHIKHSFIGSSITIPITNKKLNLGIWQGIYLLEFRNYKKSRNIIMTIYS